MNKAIISFIDRFTGAASTMDNDHIYIHEGKAFSFSGEVTLAAGVSLDIELTTAATQYVHYRPETLSTTGDIASASLYEGATVTGGTAITIYNRNRNSAHASAMTAKNDVTASEAGTILFKVAVGSGGSPQARGGGALTGAQEEYVFKPGTTYMLRITNEGSASTDVYYTLFWYEEEEGV